MWTHSTTVLQCIRQNDEKQPVFVAKRMAEILDSTTTDQWNCIRDEKILTELGTCGISYPQFTEIDWLQRPLSLKDEGWISHIDRELNIERQKVDDQSKVANEYGRQSLFGMLRSKLID